MSSVRQRGNTLKHIEAHCSTTTNCNALLHHHTACVSECSAYELATWEGGMRFPSTFFACVLSALLTRPTMGCHPVHTRRTLAQSRAIQGQHTIAHMLLAQGVRVQLHVAHTTHMLNLSTADAAEGSVGKKRPGVGGALIDCVFPA